MAEKSSYGTTAKEKSNPDIHRMSIQALVDDTNVIKQNFSPFCRQLFLSFSVLLATTSAGMTSGYSAILLPQLDLANSTISLTQEEASWIASIAALPMALGCLLCGPIMEHIGRRLTVLFVSVLFVFGWIVISFSTNFAWLMVGRFITGLCTGLIGPPISVYIAEISDPKFRGLFLAGISLAISMGIFFSHILGTFFTWQFTAQISTVLPFLCAIMLMFTPESPTFLAMKGQIEKAKHSFIWYRGCGMKALQEMDKMLEKFIMLENSKTLTPMVITENDSFRRHLTKMYFWKPFLIINALFAVTQLCGVNAVVFYSVLIMQKTIGSSIDAYLAMAIIDTIRNVFSIVACYLLRKYTRRKLAIVSTLGTTCSLLSVCFYSLLSVKFEVLQSMGYIPLISLCLYICFISIGLVPLPWIMVGEIFPSMVRSFGTAVTTCNGFIFFFAVVKTSPWLFSEVGFEGAFGFYGIVSLIGFFILYKYLPETKDKTLEQIEAHFMDIDSDTDTERSENNFV